MFPCKPKAFQCHCQNVIVKSSSQLEIMSQETTLRMPDFKSHFNGVNTCIMSDQPENGTLTGGRSKACLLGHLKRNGFWRERMVGVKPVNWVATKSRTGPFCISLKSNQNTGLCSLFKPFFAFSVDLQLWSNLPHLISFEEKGPYLACWLLANTAITTSDSLKVQFWCWTSKWSINGNFTTQNGQLWSFKIVIVGHIYDVKIWRETSNFDMRSQNSLEMTILQPKWAIMIIFRLLWSSLKWKLTTWFLWGCIWPLRWIEFASNVFSQIFPFMPYHEIRDRIPVFFELSLLKMNLILLKNVQKTSLYWKCCSSFRQFSFEVWGKGVSHFTHQKCSRVS